MGDPGGRGLGGGGNGAGLRGGLRQRQGDAHPSPLRHLRGRRGAEPVSAAGGRRGSPSPREGYAGSAPSKRSRTVRTSSAAAERQRPFWRRFSMAHGGHQLAGEAEDVGSAAVGGGPVTTPPSSGRGFCQSAADSGLQRSCRASGPWRQ